MLDRDLSSPGGAAQTQNVSSADRAAVFRKGLGGAVVISVLLGPDTAVPVLDPADLAVRREDLSEPTFWLREVLAEDLVRGRWRGA